MEFNSFVSVIILSKELDQLKKTDGIFFMSNNQLLKFAESFKQEHSDLIGKQFKIVSQEIMKEFIAEKCLIADDRRKDEYEFYNQDYIPLSFLKCSLAGRGCKNQEHISKIIDEIENTGLFKISIDEYHFPPLNEVGIENEVIPIIKFAMGVYYLKNWNSADVKELRKLLHKNIYNFIEIDRKVFQRPALRSQVIKLIVSVLNNQS
jgi:hypothetical protein